MVRSIAHRLSLCVAVLAVALASVAFAARMAPEPAQDAALANYLAMGGTLDELCGGGGTHHHAAHCPVCHLLPEGPGVALDRPLQEVVRGFGAVALADLRVGPLRDTRHSPPRGPPVLI